MVPSIRGKLTPSASASLSLSNGSVGSKPCTYSQPSGIPSKSESSDNGSIGMMFMNLPGEDPEKIHSSFSFSIEIKLVTSPGILV